MATELRVGEALTFSAMVGGSELVFKLDSKSPLAEMFAGSVDSTKIVLTIAAKHGQRARVTVQADDTVRVTRPERKAEESAVSAG